MLRIVLRSVVGLDRMVVMLDGKVDDGVVELNIVLGDSVEVIVDGSVVV